MLRLFVGLLAGKPPRQADLPTGSGKTDFVIVWLLSLAYFGLNRETAKPVPRRLAWVVNRRVLIGQIYNLARELRNDIARDEASTEIRQGLASLCTAQDSGEPLKIVQLRSGVLDDRGWSFSPSCPALIIGTVDQIGSRLLFQGYGLGKRERPMQAGLLGVDTWVCVDEAHLVPAFVMTLRQLQQRIQTHAHAPESITRLFDRLPWYLTELSATAGLPSPKIKKILAIEPEDEENEHMELRIKASRAKRAKIIECADKAVPERIAQEALLLHAQQKRVAIYVTSATTANKIKSLIEKDLLKRSKGNPKTDRILVITGRMRGVERDQIHLNSVFQALSTLSRKPPEDAASPLGRPEQTVYLIGTSAAEVGVDTDADVILCDFAPLDTLLQRLGRLDRLGFLTKAGEIPTMHIFGQPKPNHKHLPAALAIAEKLKTENYEPGATLLAANAWSLYEQADEINRAATLRVITKVKSPAKWRYHPLAPATISPTLCQPLTDAILQFWTATTPQPNPTLAVHPWFYGFAQDENNTPLVGIIFRMELDSLHGCSTENDSPEQPTDFAKQSDRVLEILGKYPPAKSEAHWLPMHVVREWLNGSIEEKNELVPLPSIIAWIDEREWKISTAISPMHEAAMAALAPTLLSEQVLVLPTTRNRLPTQIIDELTNQKEGISDVADHAWNQETPERWRRICTLEGSIPDVPRYTDQASPIVVVIDEKSYILTYYQTKAYGRSNAQELQVHQQLAARYAQALLKSLAPGEPLLHEYFASLARIHDEGKDTCIWQKYANNTGPTPLAKSTRYSNWKSLCGFRHEWESARKKVTGSAWDALKSKYSGEDQYFYKNLFYHILVSHHGYLRPDLPDQPYWENDVLDPDRLKASLCWLTLQSKLGPWRLAFLEALLKAADTLASMDSDTPNESPDEG